jgi:hypothetical protein
MAEGHKHQWTTQNTVHPETNAPGMAPDGAWVWPYANTRYCHLCKQWQQRRFLRWENVNVQVVVDKWLERS